MRSGLWPEASQPAGSMARNSSWVAGCQLQRRLWARTRRGARASGTVGSTVNRCRGFMVERSYKRTLAAGAASTPITTRCHNSAITPRRIGRNEPPLAAMSGGMAELTEVDVEVLVRDARAGDRHALGQLYDTYRDRVARFATGRLGDPVKAEDVTSETFEAVCRNLGSYRAGTDFRGVAVHHRPPAGRRPLPAPVPPPGGRPRRGGARRGGAARGRPGRGRARGGPAGRRAAGRGRRGVPAAPARPAGGAGPAGARRPVGGPGRRGAGQVRGGGAGRPAPGPPVAAHGDGGDGRMSQPNGNGPAGPDDLAALAALDLALDELAAGDVAASPIEGEAAVLAAVAAELRAAVPPPPPGAADRGRAAFLAGAAELPRKAPASPVVGRRRRLPVRVLALAAALVVL